MDLTIKRKLWAEREKPARRSVSLHCAAGGGGSFIAPVEQIHSAENLA